MIKAFFLSVFVPALTVAAGSEHHYVVGEIPWKSIFYQCLNFFALIGILFYLLKGKVVSFMSERHDLLMKSVTEAKKAKEAAEKTQAEIQSKLRDFEAQNKKLLEQVKTDSVMMQNKIREEAVKSAQNLEVEASRTVANEIGKAKAQLFDEVMNHSLEGARKLLGQSVEEPDQRRLQKEFVKKIEAVQ